MEDRSQVISSIDGHFLDVVADLREHLRSNPQDRVTAVALDGLADALLGSILGQQTLVPNEQTLRLLGIVGEAFNGHPRAMLLLSKAFIDRGDHEKALDYASRGLSNEPENPDLLFNHALCLLEVGQLEAGIPEFKQYIELEPNNPWAYNNIGTAYRSMGYFDTAEEYFQLAIKHDERFGPAYYNMAMLCMDQADWARCAHFASIAERFDPMDKNIQLALGDAFEGLEMHETAVQHLVKATLIDKTFVEAFETLASAYADLGMLDLAIAAGQQALALNQDSWMALANIGYAHTRAGDYESAIDYQLRALEKEPDSSGQYHLFWELGWDYFCEGQYDKAEDFTKRALQAREYPDVMLRFNLGLILLAKEKMVEATEAYREAIRYADSIPDGSIAMQAFNELREFLGEHHVTLEEDSDLAKLLKQHGWEI